jgi:putative RecB family exonuclease
MVIYSHSRLSTFEQCPFKFKLKYIDQIKPEIEKSIEAHLGSVVHSTLEWLYTQIQKQNLATIEEVITYYAENWQSTYTKEIAIVRKNLTEKDYFNKGVKFLLDYYMKHKPFVDGTIELEKKIIIDLDGTGKYKLQGFIDRLVYNPQTKEYEIHDYKTANTLPTEDKIATDRQLALYSIAIKEIFGENNNVLLTWHFLAHNIKICSRRTSEELEKLKKEIINLIDKIESTNYFPVQKSALCGWCEFKSMCPHFGGVVAERQHTLVYPDKSSLKISTEGKRLNDFPTVNKYIRD